MQTYNDGTMDNRNPDLARLMSLPVHNPERNRLRDVIRYSGKQLETRAFKYLTMAGEYRARKAARRKLLQPEPCYSTRLWQLTSHLFTRQTGDDRTYPNPCESVHEYVKDFYLMNYYRT